MKNTKKKGFTLVELVIVIAVIAILAAVLIPTFTSVINRANQSKAMQEARSDFEEYLVDLDYTTDEGVDAAQNSYVIKQGNYYFAVNEGQFIATAYSNVTDALDAAKPTGVTLTSTSLEDTTPEATTSKTYYFVKMTTPSNYYAYTEVPAT